MSEIGRHLADEVRDAVPADPPPYADVLTARDRRRRRRRTAVASAGAAVLVVTVLGGTAALRGDGPGGPSPAVSPSSSPTEQAESTPAGELPDVPPEWNGVTAPPIVLQLDGRQVRLDPWTSCFFADPDESGTSAGRCIDGSPQPPLEDVGDRDEVPFSFPLKGWTFEATFKRSGGGACARTITVPVERTGDHTFLIPPAGPPGSYDVDVFGRGPEGDVVTTFAWTTQETGFLPKASGYVGLVSDDGSDYIAYPLEVSLDDLASTPEDATVALTVTAADGSARTLGPVPAERGCNSVGHLFFRQGGGSAGGEPFDLGPAPFTYRAEVILDGTTYVGTAVWPDDERADEAPYTDLTFDPPLPSFEG